MELQFRNQEINFLQPVLNQVQNLEQTQQLRIPEGMPGAERIVLCRGQVLMRGKEWGNADVRLSGGIQVWILYMPEDGSGLQKLESWIPVQLDWSLPEGTPEGRVRFLPRLRFADARLISAGKILIRVGISILAQGWAEKTELAFCPENVPEDVELLRESYPVCLPQEAGEKAFDLEESLSLPTSAPHPEKIVYCKMEPQITEQKVMANKLVFRGNGNLHILYFCEDGNLHSWDFELPFSQYAQLEKSHSADAQPDVVAAVTALELEADTDGILQLKAGLTGQYLVHDRQVVELVSDAYSPYREMELQHKSVQLPVQLDSRLENIHGEQILPISADVVADAVLLADFPRQKRLDGKVMLEQLGMLQLLWYDQEGKLQGANHRWEGQLSINADEATGLCAVPTLAAVQMMENGDSLRVGVVLPEQIVSESEWEVPVIAGLTMGEKQELNPARPSLVLRRAGGERLWDIARQSGSTVAAIRGANGLEGEPAPDKMLLIPVI